MIVNLIKDKQMFSMTLPPKIKGQYWISDFDENGKTRNLVSVEGAKGEWVVKSSKKVSVIDETGKPVGSSVIKPLNILHLKNNIKDENILIFPEPIASGRQSLKKVFAKSSCEITIGRSQDNSIYFENAFVSTHHAKLVFDGNLWSVSDNSSRNGTFVNDYRITSKPLVPGDLIFIMGLKIVIGKNYFAINNPEDSVIIRSSFLQQFAGQAIKPRVDDEEEDEQFFFRSPRFRKEIERTQINIDPPPAVQKMDKVPLALMLGPSITMGMASMSTGMFTLINVMNGDGDLMRAMPTLVMSFSMLIGTVLWPILTKKHEKKTRIENENKRQEKYLAYLDSMRDKFKRMCKEQTDILNENIITSVECAERITAQRRTLWERIAGQDDFLKLRLGKGNLDIIADINYPERKFSLDDDHLLDAMYSLANEPKRLQDVPVSISFTENYIAGLIGSRTEVIGLVKNLILQMISLHSYDELKLVFVFDKEEFGVWEFSKWLPHTWNDEKTARYIATDIDEAKELSVFLEKNICVREDESNRNDDGYLPYYMIILCGKDVANKCEAINQLLKYKNNRGFSILTLYDEIKNLPKETQSVIEVNGDKSKIFDKDDITGKHISFNAEMLNAAVLDNIARDISNIILDLASQRFSLPNMLTFLEMFGVGKIEHLNPLSRWKENNPTVTLQAPIGVDTFGEPFMLDIHEKYHGPHGLVAGMTGSGKSEFIITYILSLAVNYHPDEVAFILIDYKGGGLAGAFEDDERGIKLPHLAGTITNLDGAAVKRSLISIQSELRRRQAIFNEARKISNEGTMDIYKYQQLYRDRIVTEPVPHLLIISDEFAELKTQQPEFMEQLISAARIGRSLGVHLILATQKPSGVVDDQIWSNSKFRICLKVQEKADSMDMIKRADAAELSQAGRFYLQVGFNEFFALGQSAWCGAKYIPTDDVEKKVDTSVQAIDNLGRIIKEAKISKKTLEGEVKGKQIVSIVKYLSDLAVEEKINQRPLWLPAIPEFVYVDMLEKKYGHKTEDAVLNPIVGEYDDPFNQKQNAFTLALSAEGNCIVYGSTGNGKATFVTSLVYSLIKNYSADDLNVYILDFGAETLKAFEKAPQVGGVLLSYESEKILNFFKMLNRELEKRKKLFADFGGDYLSYRKNTGKKIPNIVVALNNYSGFAEQYENLDELFVLLSRDGIKYGITFVVTASNTNAIRFRTQQNFKQILTMQLNDANDYSVIVGKTEGLIPSRFKGRGLIRLDRVYEFQTAYCCENKDQLEFIRQYCGKLSEKADSFAKRVPILPEKVTIESVKHEIADISKVPVGYARKTLDIIKINLSAKYIYPVLAQETHQLYGFTRSFADVIASSSAKTTVWDVEHLFEDEASRPFAYMVEDFEKQVEALFNMVLNRNNEYKDAKMNAKVLEKHDTQVFIIIGFNRLMQQLAEDSRDKLSVLLEKGEAVYKIHLVAVETAAQFNPYSFEAWYKKHITGSEGIWIGDGLAEQYVLKANKITSEMYEEIGDSFGYALSRGKPSLVKLISDGTAGVEDESDE